MSTPSEYLVICRGQWDTDKSLEEIQAAIDAFYVWLERCVAEGRMRHGNRLAIDRRLVSRAGITDGPFAEAKEVVGGYWFVLADSLDEAAALVAQNPTHTCGLSCEVRPLDDQRCSAYVTSNETPVR